MAGRLLALIWFLMREWVTAGKAHLERQGATFAIPSSPAATFAYPSVCES